MSTDNLKKLELAIVAVLPDDRRPTEDELLCLAKSFRLAMPVEDSEFDQLIRSLHANLAITMESGTAIDAGDHVPWLLDRKASIDPFYWERYRRLLLRSWPKNVVTTLDSVTDEILDYVGDPARPGSWNRLGMVVGDVQSGKTATYTALCAKAADAGFRLIILLTGTLESLRRQTQERLDEGFVGLDSSDFLQGAQISTSKVVGVGAIDQRRMAGVFTSRSRDFSRQIMTVHNFRLDAFKEPVLLVLKKNKKILENLEGWLRAKNAGPDGHIRGPVLLIDDEADAASVNTNDPDNDPTKINLRIRSLLALFQRSSYVGFTATPFANVFINPDTPEAMLEDLFPRDFIYALEPPTNYVGARKLFGSGISEIVRWIDDAEAHYPPKHKSHHSVTALPESLVEAIRQFVVASTLRDLRSEGPTHRSMLVNVSAWTNVQDVTRDLIDVEIRDLQRDIRNYSQLPPNEALEIPRLAGLKATFDKEYADLGFEWATVQKALLEGALPIVVKSVNQRSGSLDFLSHKEKGLRVIAVGGNSLARGLTLEGLSHSYFFRSTQMYDTLLQMGRWFGYRDGYLDLCRLWLTEEAALWYEHITVASEELRRELKRMKRLRLVPRDFGLKVRGHPDSLLVTARNKMRTARTIIREVALDGEGIETARLRSAAPVIHANAETADRFIRRMIERHGDPEVSPYGNHLWCRISKDEVAALLADFETHPLNHDFQSGQLAEFLDETDEPSLQTWDVVIPNGSLDEVTFGGLKIRPQKRNVVVKSDPPSLLVSGSSARVGSRGAEREGLSEEQIAAVEAEAVDANIPDSAWRAVRERPLLLLHLLRGFTRPKGAPRDEQKPLNPEGPPLVALGLSFPSFDDAEVRGKVIYKVNLVEWRSMFEPEDGDDDLGNGDVDR
ncbi:endonuclease [Labrys sp. LIt4]|uniref:Z1 domain-containing protein n=1 Tax=Labrys sp. LIt4 TaxID=2821355 RepID=UPI001AE0529C|nr:Z1 domain-containing protein [Labrys sp. LIt4]MBP0579589.1 endonuclease [Labrys sp. LIt4]